ncbi:MULTISPECIES: anthranilate phosphoribosyltransferase [Cyanophyceae]|uniref:anthranilate phosphoribosyltransferase n=1 Tax=Cyanophyceae TaxID=3028117 RepID=UPI00168536D9|nr:anthranilate phosphoribosyltransferase [Trichocoleus sp. FACHB-69]MBD1931701.1 anthranilate phosphoribosyltransferase [Trichocoleus sp. FACHB-69]
MKLSIPPTRSQACEVMDFLLSGYAEHDQIVSFLQSRPILDARPQELLGYRDSLWEKRRKADFGRVDLDIVGTGGVRQPRYNVSTTAAFIVAALGVRVAKHGNRGSVKPNGSFDLLEILGISLSALTLRAVESLQNTGLTFLFARDWHPAFSAIAAARSEVGKPTVFNLLGPLLNPSKPVHQMVGCGNPSVALVIAEALSELGVKALVVTGSDGLDEITLAGSSQIIEVQDNITTKEIVPEDFGMTTVQVSDIAGGDATANAAEFLAIISGQGRKHIVDLVTLNAAFALSLVEPNSTVEKAIITVQRALADGTIEAFFKHFRKFLMTEQKSTLNECIPMQDGR